MKTKLASSILLFFTLFPAFTAEKSPLKEVGDRADNIFQRTVQKIKTSWQKVRENSTFAYYTLRDKAVYSKREAEARTKLAVKEAREKADDIITDVKNKADDAVDTTKDTLKDNYKKAKKKAGEIIE